MSGRSNSLLFLIFCSLGVFFSYFFYGILQETIPESKANLSSKDYALCALCYIGAMFCSNASLRYVNYPTQVVGKSIKPIPVMLLNVLWARKRYPLRKYLFVGIVTTGVSLFMYKGDVALNSDVGCGFGRGHLLLV
ncbi:unnamed protein product, partial [Hydatigera taeniaeformis]|uniref:Solute carrier family 35 member B1 n=1 Tax=Hydatigena taeniaeformis TaxID=6205 RepID=A0A0R3WXZ1_HYDTA